MVSSLFSQISSFYQSRSTRIAVVVLTYMTLLALSLWFSYQLRFDFFVSVSPAELPFKRAMYSVILWVVPVKLLVLFLFRQYSGLLSYFGNPDLYRLLKAVAVCSALVGLVRLQQPSYMVPPRGVILIDFLLSLGALAAFRIGCRVLREAFATSPDDKLRVDATRIAIVGAGDEGANLAKELLNRRGLGRVPVVFFDDDPRKKSTRIHNVPVIGPPDVLEETKEVMNIEEVIIAMPTASAKRIGELVKELQRLHLKFVTIPSIEQLTAGKVRLSSLRPVEIQDLLMREPVTIEKQNVHLILNEKTVLVTGAGGSIGSELCRQIGSFNPRRLILVDHSEFLLFQIEQELLEQGYGGMILTLVGNILDKARIELIFQRHKPEMVFHAAALKHVPMMEYQPSEAVKVNSLGTKYLADLAEKHEVERFVMISTDKAINPTSVMGASKRLAELYVQALSSSSSQDSKTKFMAVRFGNVLGSNGSVIPTFNRQIAAGGPVKVTHPDVTRYFMTIPEAVGLVLQCGCQGDGGEIFVLDMGKPIKIVDLARQLILLSGLKLDEDIEIEYIGLRPGEKLFEELQHSEENTLETQHPKISRFVCESPELEVLESMLKDIGSSCESYDVGRIKSQLKILVPEYKPFIE